MESIPAVKKLCVCECVCSTLLCTEASTRVRRAENDKRLEKARGAKEVDTGKKYCKDDKNLH